MKWQILRGIVALIVFAGISSSRAAETACPFDDQKLEFTGTPVEQARCLLRPVHEFGNLGQPLNPLPAPLENLIGQQVTVDREKLQSYLTAHGLTDEIIGGPLTNILRAKYFVIHDVSTPNYHDQRFPTNINDASWHWNDMAVWRPSRAAHFFVNRLGQSIAAHPLTTPWRATKFESKPPKDEKHGLFVHTELVEPRRTDPAGYKNNDGFAPTPGFTEPQLDRLALLYVVASTEHGSWMVPAFHACIDAGIPNGHDDPQNFDLALWATRLGVLLQSLDTASPPAK